MEIDFPHTVKTTKGKDKALATPGLIGSQGADTDT
jgi:hypothetical protein